MVTREPTFFQRIKNESAKQLSAVEQKMYLNFLYQIQIGEDIGVLDRNNFESIICNKVNKSNRRQGLKQEHTQPFGFWYSFDFIFQMTISAQ
jgi:hypothetical protein